MPFFGNPFNVISIIKSRVIKLKTYAGNIFGGIFERCSRAVTMSRRVGPAKPKTVIRGRIEKRRASVAVFSIENSYRMQVLKNSQDDNEEKLAEMVHPRAPFVPMGIDAVDEDTFVPIGTDEEDSNAVTTDGVRRNDFHIPKSVPLALLHPTPQRATISTPHFAARIVTPLVISAASNEPGMPIMDTAPPANDAAAKTDVDIAPTIVEPATMNTVDVKDSSESNYAEPAPAFVASPPIENTSNASGQKYVLIAAPEPTLGMMNATTINTVMQETPMTSAAAANAAFAPKENTTNASGQKYVLIAAPKPAFGMMEATNFNTVEPASPTTSAAAANAAITPKTPRVVPIATRIASTKLNSYKRAATPKRTRKKRNAAAVKDNTASVRDSASAAVATTSSPATTRATTRKNKCSNGPTILHQYTIDCTNITKSSQFLTDFERYLINVLKVNGKNIKRSRMKILISTYTFYGKKMFKSIIKKFLDINHLRANIHEDNKYYELT